MNSGTGPSYKSSVKSDVSDELINTYLLRPLAHLFVRLLYPTPVTPNQVTVASLAAGFVSAGVYALGGPVWCPLAGLLVTLKDLLDSADGQLARAKQMYSRFGRFLDSIGDFAVNLAVFSAMSWSLYLQTGWLPVFFFGALGFLGISLRVSYHVFYQTSFLHLKNSYQVNRVTEEIQPEDSTADSRTLKIQKIFLVLYGWQDRFMLRIDRWSQRSPGRIPPEHWYGDRIALRLSGFLGLGTELFILMIFSVLGRLDLYLAVNVVGLNALWGICILYRRLVLARLLQKR